MNGCYIAQVARRSTAENVVVLLAVAVFLVIIILTVSLAISEVVTPSEDNMRLINWLTSVIDTILGALIGFIAGRATANGNGVKL